MLLHLLERVNGQHVWSNGNNLLVHRQHAVQAMEEFRDRLCITAKGFQRYVC